MDTRTQGGLLLAVAAIVVRLGLSDAALAYVRPGLRPLLVLTGAVLLAVGGVTVWTALRRQPLPHAHEDHRIPVAWLLLLPLLTLMLVAPPPLGAFAAARREAILVDTRVSYGPLPAEEDGAVPLTLTEFVTRASYDRDRSLRGARVRLVGFVAEADRGEDYLLARFRISCCAADALPITVIVADPQPPPPPNTWLEVEGTWRPRPPVAPGERPPGPPVLEVATRREIEPPTEPYEL